MAPTPDITVEMTTSSDSNSGLPFSGIERFGNQSQNNPPGADTVSGDRLHRSVSFTADHFDPQYPASASYRPGPTTTAQAMHGVGYGHASMESPQALTHSPKSSSYHKGVTRSKEVISVITLDVLRGYFHQPLSTVAALLGISITYLKTICRKNNITKWPFRKIQSLDGQILALESALRNNDGGLTEDEVAKYTAQLEIYKSNIEEIIANPNIVSADNEEKTKLGIKKINTGKLTRSVDMYQQPVYDIGTSSTSDVYPAYPYEGVIHAAGATSVPLAVQGRIVSEDSTTGASVTADNVTSTVDPATFATATAATASMRPAKSNARKRSFDGGKSVSVKGMGTSPTAVNIPMNYPETWSNAVNDPSKQQRNNYSLSNNNSANTALGMTRVSNQMWTPMNMNMNMNMDPTATALTDGASRYGNTTINRSANPGTNYSAGAGVGVSASVSGKQGYAPVTTFVPPVELAPLQFRRSVASVLLSTGASSSSSSSSSVFSSASIVSPDINNYKHIVP